VARKNLLQGLTEPMSPASGVVDLPASPKSPAPLPSFGGGALGAVSRSIEQIKSQGIVDLDPAMIDPSPIADRFDSSPEALEALVVQIREHGQQVPILVRPLPDRPGRYQIAYGRRRLRACAELGRTVRAMVRPLNDRELVVAQGQENSARTDLSFIERAVFAARLEEAGHGRETIMAALAVDKTGLSRLISSARTPRDLIEAIGPAPKAGRDRWIELATRLENAGALERARTAATAPAFGRKSSDDRFGLIFSATAVAAPKPERPATVKAVDGKPIARLKEDERGVTLAFAGKGAAGFGRYVAQALPDLYEAFKRHAEQAS
jgi:ParB family chromosome partitioning protein